MTPTTFKFKFNGSSSSPSSSSSPPHPAPLPPPPLPLASSALSSPNAFSANGFSSFQASSGNGGSATPKENVIVTVRFRPLRSSLQLKSHAFLCPFLLILTLFKKVHCPDYWVKWIEMGWIRLLLQIAQIDLTKSLIVLDDG
jgi:hypothetical protein